MIPAETPNRATSMRRAGALLLLLASGPLVSGCSIMHAQSRIDPRTVVDYGDPGCFVSQYRRAGKEPGPKVKPAFGVDGGVRSDANSGVVNLDCAYFPDGSKKTAYMLAAQGDSLPEGTPDTPEAKAERQRQYRNRLGNLLIKHSDDSCIASLGRAANNEAVANAGLASMTTALSAAATIVTGELAKSILTGAATTTSGVRDHINAEVFRNKIVSAVTKAINDERAKLLTEILENMKQPVAAYDVDGMIRQINFRHQACSFVRGLEIVSDAVDRKPNADRATFIEDIDRAMLGLKRDMEALPATDTDGRAKLLKAYADLAVLKSDALRSAKSAAPTGLTPAAPKQ